MDRIFLIDDDTMVNVLNKKVLSKQFPEAELIVFRNGLEALNQFIMQPPSLCLIDINMPQISGYMFLQKLRDKGLIDSCPLVVLSGTVTEDDINEITAAGAKGLIEKPLTIEKLQSVVNI